MAPPVILIAEIGINFNGDFDTCCALIDAAAEAGCDEAKFQVFSAERLYPRSAGRISWKNDGGDYTYDIFDAVRKNELPRHWVAPLMAHCKRRGIGFLASAFSVEDAAFLVDAGIRVLKLSSSSVRNLPLIDACASMGVPLIVSTGGSRLGEIEDVVETVSRHHRQLTLLHCSLVYPTPPADCHLAAIGTLSNAFPEVRVGYSDHTADPVAAPVQAVALGARMVEKHITLDRGMPGPDHFFALEPTALAAMVAAVRDTEARLAAGEAIPSDPVLWGSSAKRVSDNERYLRDFVANQIFARRAIVKGEIIAAQDLAVLRRGQSREGLPPKYLCLFTGHPVRATRDIAAEEPLDWGCIL